MWLGRTGGEIGLVIFIFVLVYWGTMIPRLMAFLTRALSDKAEGEGSAGKRADDGR